MNFVFLYNHFLDMPYAIVSPFKQPHEELAVLLQSSDLLRVTRLPQSHLHKGFLSSYSAKMVRWPNICCNSEEAPK